MADLVTSESRRYLHGIQKETNDTTELPYTVQVDNQVTYIDSFTNYGEATRTQVRFVDSTKGCPTNTVFRPVPLNTSTSNGKITISRSRIIAIFGMRLRCHAQTCGLT